MKKIALLGSTGSIGTQCLEVIRAHPQEFSLTALSAGRNIELFRTQLAEFSPSLASVSSEADCKTLAAEFPRTQFYFGIEGLLACAVHSGADVVFNALLGMLGIRPTYEAVKAGKDIAFANKETLVAAGALIMGEVRARGVRFIPVDSEHSAIFQCLQGSDNPVKRILLTGSGGPFRGFSREQLSTVRVEQALNHPRWNMGPKISVDSATLMNKGLEVIEAARLFGVEPSDIQVLIHPESIVHSAVEFSDSSVIAQLGCPDMKVPIAYAMSWPHRLPDIGASLNLFDIGSLHFERPDTETFRCLAFAYEALKAGESYPAALNAANEEAVAAFLQGRIAFLSIEALVESALQVHSPSKLNCVEDVLEIERKTREFIRGKICQL